LFHTRAKAGALAAWAARIMVRSCSRAAMKSMKSSTSATRSAGRAWSLATRAGGFVAGLGGSPALRIPAAGLVLDDEAVEHLAHHLLLGRGELAHRLELQGEVVGRSTLALVENQRICTDRQSDGHLADDLQRRLRLVPFIAANHCHVAADLIGQGLLSELSMLAERGEAFAEIHGERLRCYRVRHCTLLAPTGC